MKRDRVSRPDIAQQTLFESPQARLEIRAAFEARIRDFARSVALRHERRRNDPAGLRAALRGYHAALSLVAPAPVPPLDRAVMSLALQTYLLAKSADRGYRRDSSRL